HHHPETHSFPTRRSSDLGAGRIGKIVAKRASGFEMKVLYYDVYRMSPEDEATYHMTYMPMEDVLKQADFISIHTPYMPSTHHLIDRKSTRLNSSHEWISY